jgi:LEA14-like dessication related protein
MRALIIVLVALLAACANLAGLSQKPEVSLAGLKLTQLGLFEQRFSLQLRIQNPNDVDLPIDGLTFDVELNGQPFLKGVSDKAVRVPRFRRSGTRGHRDQHSGERAETAPRAAEGLAATGWTIVSSAVSA